MDDERVMIIVVDDNIAYLKIAKNILAEHYDVFTVPSAAKMFDLLERNKPKLILLDIGMPDMDGYEAIRLLKASPATSEIPVIFLTGMNSGENKLEALSLGAVDYISKPFEPLLLREKVESHLQRGACCAL